MKKEQVVSFHEAIRLSLSLASNKPDVVWDTSKPAGDAVRIMDVSRISSHGFKTIISFEDGVKEVMEWYKNNKQNLDAGYNVFKKTK